MRYLAIALCIVGMLILAVNSYSREQLQALSMRAATEPEMPPDPEQYSSIRCQLAGLRASFLMDEECNCVRFIGCDAINRR